MAETILSPGALTTVEKVKQQGSGIDPQDPTQDDAIRFLINSATVRMQRYARREFKSNVAHVTGTTGATGAGLQLFADANASFQTTDVGKPIIIQGAGLIGPYAAFETTIFARNNATQVILADPAVLSITNATYTYGGATRTFVLESDGFGGAEINFGMYDAQSISGVAIDTQGGAAGTALSATVPDYQVLEVDEFDGVYTGIDVYQSAASYPYSTTPYKYGKRLAQVTGIWGWPSVPADVEHGCTATVNEWLEGDYRHVGNTGFTGDNDYGQVTGARQVLPGWVMRMLETYQKLAVVW